MALRIRKGDLVQVMTGKEKGRRGKVLRVDPEKNRVYVEKVNLVKKHQRPTERNPQGGILEKEAPIHISNVMVVCPKCDKPRRFGVKFLSDGSKVRCCKKCGEVFES